MSNSKPTCLVQSRLKYGRGLIYPVNATAKLLALLTGKKTLTVGDLQVIDRLGFEVEYVPPSIEVEEEVV